MNKNIEMYYNEDLKKIISYEFDNFASPLFYENRSNELKDILSNICHQIQLLASHSNLTSSRCTDITNQIRELIENSRNNCKLINKQLKQNLITVKSSLTIISYIKLAKNLLIILMYMKNIEHFKNIQHDLMLIEINNIVVICEKYVHYKSSLYNLSELILPQNQINQFLNDKFIEIKKILTNIMYNLVLTFNKKLYFQFIQSLYILSTIPSHNTILIDYTSELNKLFISEIICCFGNFDQIENYQYYLENQLKILLHYELLIKLQNTAHKLWNLFKSLLIYIDILRDDLINTFKIKYSIHIKDYEIYLFNHSTFSQNILYTIEQCLTIYTNLNNIIYLKYEEFTLFIRTFKLIIHITTSITCLDCKKLLNDTNTMIHSYFKSFNKICLEEVREFIQCETWITCPLSDDFVVTDLSEFKLINSQDNYINLNYYIFNNINPFVFDESIEKEIEIDVSKNNNEWMCEKSQELFNTLVVLYESSAFNTFFNILRIIGRYLKGIHDFPSIWTICPITDLIYYLILCLYEIFCKNEIPLPNYLICADTFVILSKHIEQIKSELSLKSLTQYTSQNKIVSTKERIDQMLGLICSTVFLLKHLTYVYLLLSSFNNKQILVQFSIDFDKIIVTFYYLIDAVLNYISFYSFNQEEILNNIVNTKFDLKVLTTSHSTYIEILLKELSQFKSNSLQNINSLLIDRIWDRVSEFMIKMLIEGYSRVRKCSNEGRALMQLDLKQLVFVFRSLTNKNTICLVDKLEFYIKAYYLSESDILEIMKEKKYRFTEKQIKSLIYRS